MVILKDKPPVEGSYIASDSDSVLIRRRIDGRPKLLILKRADVEQILLEKDSYVFPTDFGSAATRRRAER